jgi:protein-S-isoprenylcysteine O-methyltransferase Ste14
MTAPSNDGMRPTALRAAADAGRSLDGYAKAKDDTMRRIIEFLLRVALLAFIWLVLWWALNAPLSSVMNLSVIVGGVLLTFPLVWLGRRILDRHPTTGRAVWATTFVHLGLGFTFGVPIVRAVATHRDWSGWALPVPSVIGLLLVVATGAACLLTVGNLALKGFGAPFFIALSRKLAADWSYAWTRNPMALAALSFFLSLGIWFQSGLFVLWVLILFAPALLAFLRVYEERELEIRFGASYLEYKSRTPMLFPRKPRGRTMRRPTPAPADSGSAAGGTHRVS